MVRLLMSLARAYELETGQKPRAFLVGRIVFEKVAVELGTKFAGEIGPEARPGEPLPSVVWNVEGVDRKYIKINGIEIWMNELLSDVAVLFACEFLLPGREVPRA